MDLELGNLLSGVYAAKVLHRGKLKEAKASLAKALAKDVRLRGEAEKKVAALTALARSCGGEPFLKRRDATGAEFLEYLREALRAQQGK